MLPAEIKLNKNIHIHSLNQTLLSRLKSLPRSLFLVYALFRIVSESAQLLWKLFSIRGTGFILLQNPPSMPTMLITAFVSSIKGTPWVVDWHNFAYSLLSVNRRSRKIVALSRMYEMTLGKFADCNFTVSKAFARELQKS